MGSSPLTPKAGVSDFCNLVSQRVSLVSTPRPCLWLPRLLGSRMGTGWACPLPPTPRRFPGPLPALSRLPPCIPGGQALAGAWEGAGRVVGEAGPALTLPPASPPGMPLVPHQW